MKWHFLRIIILILIGFFVQKIIIAQTRISILTCGTGNELYSVYGHSAIRIVDSVNAKDVVYNYGTFNFGDPDFYIKFTRGKLLYYLNEETFESFISLYQYEQRSISEQVLNLSQEDASKVQNFLINNIKEENKYYRYDFLFDNCSTRIRDLFETVFKQRIVFNRIISNDSVTFRTLLNHYEKKLHWERVGINLLMSDQVDKKMNSRESMFLPHYLSMGFDNCYLDGVKIVKETIDILPQTFEQNNNVNVPLYMMWGILVICIFLQYFLKHEMLLKIFDIVLFTITGLLGILMLFMWLGTDHAVCAWNRNLLWAFPLNIVLVYWIISKNEKAKRYTKYATTLIVVGLLYQFFAEQKYIQEIFPILIVLIMRHRSYSNPIKTFYFKR